MNIIIDTPIWSLAFRKKNHIEHSITIHNVIHLIRNDNSSHFGKSSSVISLIFIKNPKS